MSRLPFELLLALSTTGNDTLQLNGSYLYQFDRFNDVAARGPSGRLQAVNLRKNIRRQSGDPSKLHESTLLSAVAPTYARAKRRVGLEKRSG